MSAEPVAWRYKFPDDLQWQFTTRNDVLDAYHAIKEPLYASSPAQARALAIQEAAEACIDYANGIKEMSSRDASVAFECADIIRDMSPAQSVTEEWIEDRLENLDENGYTGNGQRLAILATLAALGITVEGAAK